jgi:hypothetical protein
VEVEVYAAALGGGLHPPVQGTLGSMAMSVDPGCR